MKIKHQPLFDTNKIVSHYTEKDGVPVKYVCTSALGSEKFAMDNADRIENVEFGMIQDDENNLHYSAHRHDYKVVDEKMIDGGRAYVKSNTSTIIMRLKNGEFYKADIK
jgi:hypothetical protein